MLLCGLLLVLVACGPERGGSEADRIDETVRIAQDYEQSADLSRARVQLQGLEVANATQWLMYLTESRIDEQPDDPATLALVKLALGLRLQSKPVMDYAAQHSLLPTVQPAPVEAGATPAAAPQVVAQAPASVAPANNADTTAAAPITNSTVSTAAVEAVATAAQAAAPVEAAVALAPTATSIPKPMAQASNSMNVRGGPGTVYPVVGAMNAGEQAEIIGKNPQADWWQVLLPGGAQGWLLGALVTTVGDTSAIAVAANIPEPPPTATPAPVAAAPVEAVPAPPAEQPPAEQAPAEQPPAEQPPAEQPPAAPPSDKPHFSLVEKRMWSKAENGDCRGQHLLRIHVLDANGNRLNGVALQGIYIGEIIVTGAQGKGDGIIEYDLHGSGEGFRVIRDADGRDATSDPAEGFTTRSIDIPQETLIAGGYCTNDTDCKIFYDSYGCHGHHSWEATFKRNY
jgi:uncharacterized protein YraI